MVTYNPATDAFEGFDETATAATNASYADCIFSLRLAAQEIADARKARRRLDVKLWQQCQREWEANAIGWASR